MSSRDEILKKLRQAQPTFVPLPHGLPLQMENGNLNKFSQTLESIGGRVIQIGKQEDLNDKLKTLFPFAHRIVSSTESLEAYILHDEENLDLRSLDDVDIAIVKGEFGVAENAAVWVTEADIKLRVLPFIAEHLVVLLDHDHLVPSMHHAYQRIGADEYGFGVFIAGPSKTADIEQSLVLGAHGPRTMTVLMRI